jgi:hypothetical protein
VGLRIGGDSCVVIVPRADDDFHKIRIATDSRGAEGMIDRWLSSPELSKAPKGSVE